MAFIGNSNHHTSFVTYPIVLIPHLLEYNAKLLTTSNKVEGMFGTRTVNSAPLKISKLGYIHRTMLMWREFKVAVEVLFGPATGPAMGHGCCDSNLTPFLSGMLEVVTLNPYLPR
jgi:hypothetical protein